MYVSRNAWEQVDQAAVVATYRRLGVPGLERSTARVGNSLLSRALRLVEIPGYPEYQLVPRIVAPQFTGGDRAAASDMLWARLQRDLQRGVRYIYHLSNHYCRIFGFREARVDDPPCDVPTFDTAPRSVTASLPPTGGDSDGEGTGVAASAAASGPDIARPVVIYQKGETRREILIAQRGQSPKHWVDFHQVVADIFQHKLHRLLAVSMVQRPPRGNQQTTPGGSDSEDGPCTLAPSLTDDSGERCDVLTLARFGSCLLLAALSRN